MRWTRRHLLANLPLLLGPAACTQQPTTIPVDTLTRVHLFAFGGVGFSGRTSEGEKAYRALAALPNALEYFLSVYTHGTPEACCYALVAIRRLDATKFQELLTSIRQSTVAVNEANGCILFTEKLGVVAGKVASGSFDPLANRTYRSPA